MTNSIIYWTKIMVSFFLVNSHGKCYVCQLGKSIIYLLHTLMACSIAKNNKAIIKHYSFITEFGFI